MNAKVTMKISKRVTLSFALTVMLLASACAKKKVVVPPPPQPIQQPAPPPAAVAAPARAVVGEFAVEPSSIARGQSATLRWSVTGSNSVSINTGIGTVPASGTRRVNPTETTTYTLTASGPGGDATASATVTVTMPPPPPAAAPRQAPSVTFETRVENELRDALFDYDSNNITDSARAVLTANADALKKIFADFPRATIIVEGHCDERGSAEYNLGLGDRRSTASRDFLAQLGISADRLKTVSYGKERPTCNEASEGCFQKNRRAHFSAGQ